MRTTAAAATAAVRVMRTTAAIAAVCALVPAQTGYAQTVAVSGELSPAAAAPNDEVTLTLTLEDPADLYYFGMVVELDPDQVEFLSLEATGLTEGGIQVGGYVTDNNIAVAVSRTDGEVSVQNGPFMKITFRVKSTAEAGAETLHFLDPNLTDSEGEDISFTGPDPLPLDILEGIGTAGLTIPAVNQVTEGDPFVTTAHIYASGLDGGEEESDRLETWAGISPEDSDPAGWDESLWQPMEPDGVSDLFYSFKSETALYRDPGTYAVALRTRLDDGAYVYGGLDGFWDGVNHPSSELEILQLDAFRYSLAFWDFSGGKRVPAYSIPENDLAEILMAGPVPGEPDPADTHASGGITYLNTRGWQPAGDGGDAEAYLHIGVSTARFENLQFGSSHRGSSSGPSSFVVQLSLDGEDWEDLSGGGIDLASENAIHLENLPLPDHYDDRELIHIRWLKSGDERIDGKGTGISASGIHRIGDIGLTGTNISPDRIEVYPGDINRDDIVNAEDVLTLAHYWLSRGPVPAYDFIDFEPREVEEWIPSPATYADTNGDGIVNQEDLQAVGLNFGESGSAEKPVVPVEKPAKEPGPPVARADLPALKSGEEIVVRLASESPQAIKGLAYRITLQGIPADRWTVAPGRLADWAGKWNDESRLVEFRKKHLEAFEEALIVQGRQKYSEGTALAEVRIIVSRDWEAPAVLSLEWLAVSRPDGAEETVERLEFLRMDAEYDSEGDTGPDPPDRTGLEQNFPNPFHPRTRIRYQLSQQETVRLDVYDAAGRKVATLVDRRQPQGRYEIDFDAGAMASGVYMYRLQAGEALITRSMVLVR